MPFLDIVIPYERVHERTVSLLVRHPWNGRYKVFRCKHGFAFHHALLVTFELICEHIIDVIQPHSLASLELTTPPDHVNNLVEQRDGIGGFLLLNLVSIHDDSKKHVQQHEHHDQHERQEPEGSFFIANLFHTIPVPVSEHRQETCVECPADGAEALQILPEEENAVHEEANEDAEENQEEVCQVGCRGLQRSSHNGKPRLSLEGFEKPQHDDQGIHRKQDAAVLDCQ
mmetsp:Transcript_10772/g.19151  ORF Transcript_10772/g.19151 Transcript_10772/m.19151 type:complete len:228 (-) Transcript_10772:578-1261(-)